MTAEVKRLLALIKAADQMQEVAEMLTDEEEELSAEDRVLVMDELRHSSYVYLLLRDGKGEGVCHECLCTQARGCPEGCGWANAEQTLCTACEEKEKIEA